MTSLIYQNIVDLIRATANAVNPSGTFVHARRSDGSLEYDGDMPQIHLYPFNVRGKEAKDADLLIGFWQQDSPETSNEEREAIISEMDVLSQQFFETLDETETIEIVNLITEPNYRQLAGTLSGYIGRFTLRGGLSCDDIPIPVTTCDIINAETAAQIVDCLKPEKLLEVEALICGSGTCEYDVYINGTFSQSVTLTDCADLTINLV